MKTQISSIKRYLVIVYIVQLLLFALFAANIAVNYTLTLPSLLKPLQRLHMVVPDVITSQIIASSSTHDHAPAFAFVKSFKSILSSLRTSLRTSPHTDNIGSVDYTDRLSYPPIDAVYTWVNGSDPVWLSSKSAFAPPPPASVMVHNDTALKNGTANATAAQTSDSASNNRYRDSNELKYSLRSLEKVGIWGGARGRGGSE
jgi:hypothetical protein